MKKMLAGIAAIALLSACNRFEKTENGIEYKIVTTSEDARMVATEDNLHIHLKGVIERNDSAIFDSYKNNKPFYIPAGEPSLKEVFAIMKKGDSIVFKIMADTLYKNFGEQLPAGIQKGDVITFYANLIDLYNPQEMQQKINEQNQEFLVKDSIALSSYISGLTDVTATSTGFKYQIETKGKGKACKKGDKVTVRYRGSLLDGFVFDETKPGTPEFTFVVGAGQVIAGWDEGLQLMSEGDKFKFIIPWNLGYGPRGSGPIPPYSTLLFDVELVKVN
ncbi:MAG: FKBP-type peptidyl-prolyl cis-trans isomerase [Bacteroidia bacterium]|nr:FKBP-type peptidyl-prolyl cis-trans isomerase [Bacteroidia bacterium]MCF8425680.1 FKBP-type peptidyl-prolyl cis-trans isomerase [Bacteroidia bacterium]MCF8447269.1 FKBP-type peptidyl-prolyl cis-trans isomerase [Bacteroidia bacterium]